MKLAWMAPLLLALTAFDCSAQQTNVPDATTSKVIIQLLNGKNGKPIKNESPNIWLGNGPLTNPRTNSSGEIILEIGQAQPQEIRVTGNYYVDCLERGEGLKRYSLDEIVSKGIVTENDCGKSRRDAIPGRLIFYLRPMTFKEKWLL